MRDIDLEAFQRDGYVVIRQLFSPDEAEAFRDAAIELVERLDAAGDARRTEGPTGVRLSPRGDMLTYEPLRRILLDPRILAAVSEVLGGQPAYWGESAVNIGDSGGGARGWHTDAYDTPVTHGAAYPLVRCGLYLQDTTRHSDGLALVAGSHLRSDDELSVATSAKLRRAARPWLGARNTKLVESRPGDFVIWDMRILHSGEVVRLKPAPSLPLPLRWQGALPRPLRMPQERRRVVMFPTFGLPGPDLDSYLARQRSLDWMRDIWKASVFAASVVDEAANAGLQVIRPIPEYGSPVETSAVS